MANQDLADSGESKWRLEFFEAVDLMNSEMERRFDQAGSSTAAKRENALLDSANGHVSNADLSNFQLPQMDIPRPASEDAEWPHQTTSIPLSQRTCSLCISSSSTNKRALHRGGKADPLVPLFTSVYCWLRTLFLSSSPPENLAP